MVMKLVIPSDFKLTNQNETFVIIADKDMTEFRYIQRGKIFIN